MLFQRHIAANINARILLKRRMLLMQSSTTEKKTIYWFSCKLCHKITHPTLRIPTNSNGFLDDLKGVWYTT